MRYEYAITKHGSENAMKVPSDEPVFKIQTIIVSTLVLLMVSNIFMLSSVVHPIVVCSSSNKRMRSV